MGVAQPGTRQFFLLIACVGVGKGEGLLCGPNENFKSANKSIRMLPLRTCLRRDGSISGTRAAGD